MDRSGALSGMTLRLADMHNSSFLQPRSVVLSGWLTKPADWLSEKVKISPSQTCLINLKLRENDY
ncbi:hypothetical protein HKD37_05G012735 [Glycine soja]